MLSFRVLTVVAAVGLIAVCGLRVSAHDPITTKVTWSKEVVRIVQKDCAGCHVAGGVAPMPLVTYADARPWARAIKDEVVARRMPRWPAARGFGEFQNDHTLSPFEIELISAWADGGAPKGEDRDLPAAGSSKSAGGGTAQLPAGAWVLPLEARKAPPAGEQRSFTVPIPAGAPQWVTGWQFTPNDAAILEAEFVSADETIGAWVPPAGRTSFPAGAAQSLPRGGTVTVTVTYRSAKLQQDFPVPLPGRAPALALLTRATAPPLRLHHAVAACGASPVPAGASIVAVRIAGAPDAGAVGVALTSPNRAPEPLVWIRSFDPGYRPTLQLRTPVVARAGDEIDVTGGSGSACRVDVSFVR